MVFDRCVQYLAREGSKPVKRPPAWLILRALFATSQRKNWMNRVKPDDTKLVQAVNAALYIKLRYVNNDARYLSVLQHAYDRAESVEQLRKELNVIAKFWNIREPGLERIENWKAHG